VHADQVLAVLGDTDAAAEQSELSTPPVGASLLANAATEKDSKREDSRASSLLHETPAQSVSATGDGDASPLAARMARQAGVDLLAISGSGRDGRILADDVRAAVGPVAGALGAPAPEHAAIGGGMDLHGGFEPEFDIQTPDNMRRVIAERLAKSKREAPHFYMSLDCRADALLDLKTTLTDTLANTRANTRANTLANTLANTRAETLADSGAHVSLNDLILKVTATALKRVPALNAAWSDAGIRTFRRVDLAVAVAIEGGLITPVVRDADSKRVADIAREMRDLVARARAGQLSREEYQGGTFTVSNMGMYGVSHFTAVINPPQAAILAVGAVSERAIVRNGELSTAPMMTCTLSVDHRVSDGVAAAEFLQTFKRLAEDPRLLLL
jgi:pyruvate dehydrogenase E2 component (dihydrolipoamide acetyltransferase)